MTATPYVARAARYEDFGAIQQVETRAAQRFTGNLAFIAQAPPLPIERLAEFHAVGGLHVLVHNHAIVGMAAHTLLDGVGYLAELDVVPEHAGQRLGQRILKRVIGCLIATRVSSLWLTTYRDVPWNGPYYRRIGFIEATPGSGSELHRQLTNEKTGRLGSLARIAMVMGLRGEA
jgi:GNAT superfamily N-acetyltransferase